MSELENKAAALMDRLIQGIDKGVEQAPALIQDLAHEYVNYYLAHSVSNIVAILGAIIALIKIYKMVQDKLSLNKDLGGNK